MRHLHRLLPLCLAVILAGMAVSKGHRSDQNSPISGARVSLAQVVAAPLDYLGGELRFSLAVESQPQAWNPFLTRFGSEDYRAVVAWGDEQPLWERSAFEAPATMLFARRGSACEAALEATPRYGRLEATGIVRQVHGGKPWIELVALSPLKERFTEGSLIHAARGVELMAAEHYRLAAASFERALASDLPERARTELDRLRLYSLSLAPAPIEIPVKNKR
jgi:hypothetical protein